MPKSEPKYEPTDSTSRGQRTQKSAIIVHGENCFSSLHQLQGDSLRFLANLDDVPFSITDFKELCIATILNRLR